MGASGGRVERRLDPGTWRVVRSPDVLVARSRTAGALRRIAPDYTRITFDKAVLTRPRRTDDDATMPPAETCGPGHPLFRLARCLVYRSNRRSHAERSALRRPGQPNTDDCEVRRSGRRRRQRRARRPDPCTPSRRTTAVATSKQNSQPCTTSPCPTVRPFLSLDPPDVDATTMWARQHVVEERYWAARKRRELDGNIQTDFLRRSFTSLLAPSGSSDPGRRRRDRHSSARRRGRLRKANCTRRHLKPSAKGRLREAEPKQRHPWTNSGGSRELHHHSGFRARRPLIAESD